MSGPSDPEMNWNPDSDKASGGPQADAPKDMFDQLDSEEDGGLFTPTKLSSSEQHTASDDPEGGIGKPIKVTPHAHRIAFFKIAAAILSLILVGTAGVIFWPLAFKGEKQKRSLVQKPIDDETRPASENGNDLNSRKMSQPKSTTFAQLSKKLESPAIQIGNDDLDQINSATIAPMSDEVNELKGLKTKVASRIKIRSDMSVNYELMLHALELKLEEVGEMDDVEQSSKAPMPPNAPAPPVRDDEPKEKSGAVMLPMRFSILLMAMFCALDNDTDNLDSIMKALETKPDADKADLYLLLVKIHLKRLDVSQALDELVKAEKFARKYPKPNRLKNAEEMRRQLMNVALKEIEKTMKLASDRLNRLQQDLEPLTNTGIIAKSVQEMSNDVLQLKAKLANLDKSSDLVGAAKSLLKTGTLLSMIAGKAEKPEGVENLEWDKKIELVKELAERDDEKWNNGDALADYYLLSQLHALLIGSDFKRLEIALANSLTKDDALKQMKALLARETFLMIAKGTASRPESVKENDWDVDVKFVQELAEMDDDAQNVLAATEVFANYRRLRQLNDVIHDDMLASMKSRIKIVEDKVSGPAMNEEALSALASLLKSLLKTRTIQSVVRGKVRRPAEIDEENWNDDIRLAGLDDETIKKHSLDELQKAYYRISRANILLANAESNEQQIELVVAVKALLKLGTLRSVVGDVAAKPDYVDAADWDEAVKRTKELVGFTDITWAERPLGSLVNDYYQLSLLHLSLAEKIKFSPGDDRGIPATGSGVSRAALEARVKKAEEGAAKQIDDVAQLLKIEMGKRKEDSEKISTLAMKIELPRPISPEQISKIELGLQGTIKTAVGEELARRGIVPTELPSCELPKKQTPNSSRQKALHYYGDGCTYFYSNSTEQMPAAIRCFTMATNLDPNDPAFRYYLGCSLYLEGQSTEAVKQVRCAATIEKRLDSTHDVLRRIERIQFGPRQWLERCRQSVFLGQ